MAEEEEMAVTQGDTMPDSPRGDVKNVFIYRNGDTFFRPRRFVVNSKQFRNYESFLRQVTSTLKPRFGCVRKLHTPDSGHRVGDLEDLEQGQYYVAAGKELFSKLPYKQIPEKETRPTPRTQKEIRPVYHSRLQVSARARKPRLEPVTIFVYENGNELKPSARVLLTPRELTSWEQVLSAVSDRITLSAKGAVCWLYTMTGQKVVEVSGLKNNETYVAVAADGRYLDCNYGAVRKPLNTSPKLDRKKYERLELDGIRSKQTANSRKNRRTVGVKKASSGGSTGTNSSSRRTDDDDVFRNGNNSSAGNQQQKPVHAQKGGAQKTDYDQDDGPFKSSGQNGETKGAREVEETAETKVDLPIDQVPAEEVQDEDPDNKDNETSREPVENNGTKQAEDDDDPARAKAATKIQANYRGYKVRKHKKKDLKN